METVGGPLSGQDQHRCAVHVGIGDAGDQVRSTRTERAERASRVAREPAVDLCHECGTLFVPRQDEPNLLRFFQRHHEIGVFLAGHAEDVLNAFFLEALDEQV